MPERNLCTDGFNPHHDLCAEVAQMSHGHIGFGCYGAFHNNEDGDLAAAGDKNIEFLCDELYAFEPEPEKDENELDSSGDEDTDIIVGKRQDCFKADHLTFDLLLNRTPAENTNNVRSEVLAARCHRGIKRLQAEGRKHQQFFEGVRVR